tara:strand:- start:3587 stop:4618 length:1032 start_codon:yes stop_codon:yes gene_type:complete
MQNRDSSVSILIPTFNRSNILLKLTKEIIIPVATRYKNHIEFFIRDNTGLENIVYPLDELLKLPVNVNYRVNEYNLLYHGNIKKLLDLANNKYIWFWGDDDNYDLNQIFYVLDNVIYSKIDYQAYLPGFSYCCDKTFNSNRVLGDDLKSITLEGLFRKNKAPFALISSLIFKNVPIQLNNRELSNAWLHAIIFLKSLSKSSNIWINSKPTIFYESVSSEINGLEQRNITLDYYLNSTRDLINCQMIYAGVEPPTEEDICIDIVRWMIQHKGRLIYWSFYRKDIIFYGLKGIYYSIIKLNIKLGLLSMILLLLPKQGIRLLYRLRKRQKRESSSHRLFFKTIQL